MPTLLIATDNTEDAKVVRRQLADQYKDVFTSTNADTTRQNFEAHRPDVLVRAFDALGKADIF